VIFSLQLFEYFLLLLLLLSSSFIALWSDSMQGVISVFLYLLRLCDQRYAHFGESSMGCWEECIVLFQDGILNRCLSGLFNLWCHLTLELFLVLFLNLDQLSIGDRGVLQSPTTTVLRSICDFKSISIWLMKLGAMTMGTYKLILSISSCWIAPFISMKWPFFVFSG
jgi:hypothetical protein